MPTKKKSSSEKRQDAMRKELAAVDKKAKEEAERKAKLPKVSGIFMALRNFTTPRVAYVAGQTYKIPIDLSEDQARSWLAAGYIEQHNPLPGPSEVK